MPKRLKDEGAKEIEQTRGSACTAWEREMAHALSSSKGELLLILGGIGSGKTTFLRRYQRTVGSRLLENSFWFHVSFLGPPSDPTAIERYICQSILDTIRSRYRDAELERRKLLKKVFRGDIRALEETVLANLKEGTPVYEQALSPHLEKWQREITDYVPKLLRTLIAHKERSTVLFIDNVDQLSPAYQQQIFIVAQGLTHKIGAITVVALREESYYTPNVQKTFTAYATRKFHIAAPSFRTLIENRINLALTTLSNEQPDVILRTAIELDRKSIVEYFKIVEFSIFQRKGNIARMVEALCFGNMRQALMWFSTFLTSEATDVDKMLKIYRRDGAYYVAHHEFLKSIMLAERRYYSEAHSHIMNLFDCGTERNASHFTSLRLLSFLLAHLGEDNPEGRGYFSLSSLASLFEDVFDNREDLLRTSNRLLRKQLIEVNTRSTETILNASHARVTSAGWYYAKYLVNMFAYLDLVLQDTPLDDAGLERSLRDSVQRLGNLPDQEEGRDKLARTDARFKRVDGFLEYLSKQEQQERKIYHLGKTQGPLGVEWMPGLISDFGKQKDWIRKRIIENREKYAEEVELENGSIDSSGEFAAVLDSEDADA